MKTVGSIDIISRKDIHTTEHYEIRFKISFWVLGD